MPDFKMDIPFFDASNQYFSQKEKIDVAIQRVLEEGKFINGPEVGEFSSKLASYLKINHVIPCANGTDALYLALMALGLEKGDEIIVPTFNFIAVSEAVVLLGLIPVFVDSAKDDFNIDVSKIEQAITSKTKVIVAVHLFGAVADMEQINRIAQNHQLFVVEDVAQSLGSQYKGQKAGTIGHIGCTSFFPTKNLACFGDGGAVFTNDSRLAEKIKMLANHGQKKKYEHQYVGVNSRLDTIQAAILIHQLTKLDANIEKRRTLAQRYNDGLKKLAIVLPSETDSTKHSFNQYCIQLKNFKQRYALKQYLEDRDICTMIYYSQPNHLQEAFSCLGYNEGDFPFAEHNCARVLALPIFTGLTFEQQDYIINHINYFFANA